MKESKYFCFFVMKTKAPSIPNNYNHMVLPMNNYWRLVLYSKL
ncbi:hypothetical protein M23134_04608 [Microscilla marina ATCC 23134]|uniref:Uncharacterized protein n=1 Tax=Microscilla marina ATCC 23134 TaxID=313606 RepID=A1ZTA8_MICM2|nr:hypothetical protein M23134_04608 [Microscilla marina ATCC 23134]